MRVGPGHIVVSSLVRGIGATVVREKYGRRAEFAERQLANCRCAKANHCRVGCQLCLPTKLGHTNLFSSFLIISEIALAIQPDPKRKPALEADPAPSVAPPGWRRARATPSLVEVYRTIPVAGKGWWRKIAAFAGPGYLVAVGYMDPGNWATDLAGGSKFGYALLSVI